MEPLGAAVTHDLLVIRVLWHSAEAIFLPLFNRGIQLYLSISHGIHTPTEKDRNIHPLLEIVELFKRQHVTVPVDSFRRHCVVNVCQEQLLLGHEVVVPEDGV